MTAETARRWRKANPEKQREHNRRWYEANREKIRAQRRRYYEANRDKQRQQQRDAQLWRMHGMYPHDWAAMWASQGGCCYLCSYPLPDDPAKVAIDHDHRCCPMNRSCRRCRRGMAHKLCNVIIGAAGDDPALLRWIADRLEETLEQMGDLVPPPALFGLRDLS
jgi:hypothetical protein